MASNKLHEQTAVGERLVKLQYCAPLVNFTSVRDVVRFSVHVPTQ